jgi:hypothetical protein
VGGCTALESIGMQCLEIQVGMEFGIAYEIESNILGEIISNKVVVLEIEARITSILILTFVFCRHGSIFEKENQEEVILNFLCTLFNKTSQLSSYVEKCACNLESLIFKECILLCISIIYEFCFPVKHSY